MILIEIKELVEKYLANWKWFLLSAILFLVLAFFYLRKETPKYEVNATILIKDKEKGTSIDDFTTFEDLGLTGANSNNLENEIHLLSSEG